MNRASALSGFVIWFGCLAVTGCETAQLPAATPAGEVASRGAYQLASGTHEAPAEQPAAFASTLDCSQGERPFLHPLFSDHMVLQAGIKARLWGCTAPGAPVQASFSGAFAATLADGHGRWEIELGPFAPSPVGRPLTVEGAETRKLQDVLVGEVWLCSGQSNMQYGLQGSLNGSEELLDSVNYPHLRLFQVGKDNAPLPGQVFRTQPSWSVSGQPLANTQWFSAVCYFMGRELTKKLKVPVGLIDASFSGSVVESWISADVLRAVRPSVKPKGPAESAFPFYDSSLYNAMIAPLLPFPLRGAVWYQGEGNANQPATTSSCCQP